MINLKKFKELHSKRQTKNLTVFEKYKIQSSFKSPIEGLILTHLYTKFLYFKFKEFNQRKFDIKVGIGNFSENTITNNLKSLEKKGYFTSEFKQVKGKNYNRLHFNINLDKMNEFLSTGDDLKPENFSMLIENLRRENEVVKDNPINIEEPTENHTDELVGLNTIESIQEPTKQIEEPTEPLNSYEDIRRDLDENLYETKINKTKIKEMRNNNNSEMCEQAKLLTEYKDKIGLKNVFHDLDLTVDTVNYLYSSQYIEGVDRKLDDKKASIDVIINQKINPMRGIKMVFN